MSIGRRAPWLVVLVACRAPSSTLAIDGQTQFDRIELFFVTKDAPTTDVDEVPHTSQAIDVPITTGPTTRWLRAYDENDIWIGDPTAPVSEIRLGIPSDLGVGSYVAVVATQHTADGKDNPVAIGELTGYTDEAGITYPITLSPITATTPGIAAVPAALSGMHWLASCVNTLTDSCMFTVQNDPPVKIAGTSADHFVIRARIRGVMERNLIASAVEGSWTPVTTPGHNNAFELTVGTSTTYVLNAAAADLGTTVQPWDYLVTFPVAGGDQISFSVVNNTGAEALNRDENMVAYQIPGITTMPDPYTGQFARLDVLDVTHADDATLTSWPDGLEVWTPHDAEQACLRFTANGTTTFVVTAGDQDCDSFVDSNDCDPLRYCDPTSQRSGCAVACDAQVQGECMIGTCVNDYTSGMDTSCSIGPDKPSVCFTCDASCTGNGDSPDRDAALACIAASQVDQTCSYSYTMTTGGNMPTPYPCPIGIPLMFPGACVGASILNPDPNFPLSVYVDTTMPCAVKIEPVAVPMFAPTNYNVMLGLETPAGATDTFVLQLTPSEVSYTSCSIQAPVCNVRSPAHDCGP